MSLLSLYDSGILGGPSLVWREVDQESLDGRDREVVVRGSGGGPQRLTDTLKTKDGNETTLVFLVDDGVVDCLYLINLIYIFDDESDLMFWISDTHL